MAGAVRLASPPLHSFANAHRHTCVCLSFVVEPLCREFSSTAPKCKKNRPFGRLFLAGAVRLASPPLHSFANAHRHTCVCLSFVVEPLCREFSSTAPKCKKNRPFGRLFLAGAVRFELTTLGFGDRCSTN